MATPVIMPRQGQSVESCIIAKWHKKKGDSVNKGDILFTYETDKASFEEEATVSGIMLDVFFEEGDDVTCLLNVCVIGSAGESTAEFNPNADKTAQAPVQEEKKEEPQAISAPVVAEIPVATQNNGEFKISPRARNLAERSGADLRAVSATGPNGRVIERDVDTLIDAGKLITPAAMGDQAGVTVGTGIGGRISVADLSAPQTLVSAQTAPTVDFVEEKLPNIRKVIAKAMHNSLSNLAQLTLNSSFDATNIMNFRKQLKVSGEALGMPNITINDIILYTVSRVLLNHRECNAHFYDDKMVFFNNAHVGVAVDTDRGLLVPTLFNLNKMSLCEISSTAKAVITSAQKGTISPDMLKGASFTVTNLGTLGVESFTPVINPPQTCILGVCSIVEKVKVVDGVVKTYPSMGLSLTFDHRALDGAPAAKFLKALVTSLENFTLMLAK
jgi:pyruvate dehydrogenase E2 component (dihydrolipoamide acetyltransferase)